MEPFQFVCTFPWCWHFGELDEYDQYQDLVRLARLERDILRLGQPHIDPTIDMPRLMVISGILILMPLLAKYCRFDLVDGDIVIRAHRIIEYEEMTTFHRSLEVFDKFKQRARILMLLPQPIADDIAHYLWVF